jgi:hypothetical protein
MTRLEARLRRLELAGVLDGHDVRSDEPLKIDASERKAFANSAYPDSAAPAGRSGGRRSAEAKPPKAQTKMMKV